MERRLGAPARGDTLAGARRRDLALQPWFSVPEAPESSSGGYAEPRPDHTSIVPSIIFWVCGGAAQKAT